MHSHTAGAQQWAQHFQAGQISPFTVAFLSVPETGLGGIVQK